MGRRLAQAARDSRTGGMSTRECFFNELSVEDLAQVASAGGVPAAVARLLDVISLLTSKVRAGDELWGLQVDEGLSFKPWLGREMDRSRGRAASEFSRVL